MPNITMAIVSTPIDLGRQLAATAAAVEDAGDALGVVGRLPFQPTPYEPSAKIPTASTPNAPQTPCTEIAPTGSSTPRFSMNHTRLDDDDAGDDADDRRRPRLHERARRRDRNEAGEHAVGHHPGIGLLSARATAPRTSR